MTPSASPKLQGFRFERTLKNGSACEVHLVVSKAHGRRLVVKALKPEVFENSGSGKSLELEATLLARLHHPNIVTFVDFVKEAGGARLVTDHLSGSNLAELLETRGRMSARTAVHIGIEIARGIAYLHEQGIVHGLLEPSNILCADSSAVQLCDLGHAISTRDAKPAAGSGRNTRIGIQQKRYQAPEQNLGSDFDERADNYVLGVLLFQLIAGQPPEGEPGRNHRRGADRNRGPSVAAIVPKTPRAMDALIAQLLADDPDARPQLASSVVETLAKIIDREGYGDRTLAFKEAFRDAQAQGTTQSSQRNDRGDWLAFAGVGGAFALLCALLQLSAGAKSGFADLGAAPLVLTPTAPGYLRVVANPWAEVWVDGQLVETTPFLKPIPLESGPHFVTLKHPAAPDDRREVQIRKGETLMLEATFAPNPSGDGGAIPIVRDAGGNETPSHNPNIARPKLTR